LTHGRTSDLTVTAVRDLRITKGSAGAHAFECDDGQVYFVKFKDGTRTVVNEHLGFSLARFLELPVPESCHVMVPQNLIDASAELGARGITAGEHHGTRLMEPCVDFRGLVVRNLVLANADTLPGLVVLDNLVLNMDRNNPGNNLLQTMPSGSLEFRTVDFNEILSGRNWTVETMEIAKRTSYLMPVFPTIALPVKGLPSFSPWLEKTESISSEDVDQMLSGIPAPWDLGEAGRTAILDFLLTRKDMVRAILMANKSRFLNWR
jgi:hypothetical protein